PDSVRQELEPDFVVEQTGPQYYVLAIKTDKMDFTDLLTKMSQFNDEYHQFENLRANTYVSNDGYQLLVVREFTDYQKGTAYIKDIDLLDYVKKQLNIQQPYLHFIISPNNFK